MHYRAIFALLLLTFSLAGAQDIPIYTVSYGDITFSFRGTVATGVDVAEEADGVNVSPFAMFPPRISTATGSTRRKSVSTGSRT